MIQWLHRFKKLMEPFVQGLNKTVEINPTFTWQQWELYDTPDSERIAIELNFMLALMFNAGASRRSIEAKMSERMASYSQFGANDTEPRVFLNRILNHLFP